MKQLLVLSFRAVINESNMAEEGEEGRKEGLAFWSPGPRFASAVGANGSTWQHMILPRHRRIAKLCSLVLPHAYDASTLDLP